MQDRRKKLILILTVIAVIAVICIHLLNTYASYYFNNRKIFAVDKWDNNIWQRENMVL